jgi:VWFA-related protein
MFAFRATGPAVVAILFALGNPAIAISQSDNASTIPPLQINVRNVLVDVVVTDKKGSAVPGLKKEDFQLLENGKAQRIEFFEPHFPVVSAAAQPAPQLPVNTFTNVPAVQPNEAINILLMDALNTRSADQIYVRRQMLKYLDSLPPGLRVGVFLLGDRLRIIQGFTDDSTALKASIERLANKPLEVALESTPDELASQTNSFNDLYTMTADPGGINANGGAQLAGMIADLQAFMAHSTEAQQNQQLLITLDALQAIAHYASAVPGRKNLIWFVGSFPLCLPPTVQGDHPVGYAEAQCPYGDQVKIALNEMAAARVSIYPVDAGGVMALNSDIGGSGSDQAGSIPPGTHVPLPAGVATPAHNAAVASDAPYFRFIAAESWAETTGGKAAHHNDINGAIAEAIQNGSSYYTIAYAPTDSKEIGRDRKIEIRVPSGNYKLSYRREYFERTPAEIKAASAVPDHDPLRPLMDRGMPNFADLHYRVRVEPDAGPLAPDAAHEGDNPQLKPPVKRYTVRFFLSPENLNLVAGPDGVRRAPIEVALVAYSQRGESLNWLVRSVNLAIRPDQMGTAQSSGIPFHFDFDVPPGDVYLRTGVYDPSTQRAGTLEIPMMAVRPVQNKAGATVAAPAPPPG